MAWMLAAALVIGIAVDAGASEAPHKPGKCAVSAVGERSADAVWIPAAVGLWFCLRRRNRR